MRTSLGLIGIGHAATIVGLLQAVPRHIVDPAWPAHAQTHVFQALVWIIGLNLICLIVLSIPFRARERWAWWTLFGAGFFVYGAYWVPEPITHGGAPGIVDDIFFATAWALQLIGLYLCKGQFFNDGEHNQL